MRECERVCECASVRVCASVCERKKEIEIERNVSFHGLADTTVHLLSAGFELMNPKQQALEPGIKQQSQRLGSTC